MDPMSGPSCGVSYCRFQHHVGVWLPDGTPSVWHGAHDSGWTGVVESSQEASYGVSIAAVSVPRAVTTQLIGGMTAMGMRSEEDTLAMLHRIGSHADEHCIFADELLEAIYDAVMWVYDEDVEDNNITNHFPEKPHE